MLSMPKNKSILTIPRFLFILLVLVAGRIFLTWEKSDSDQLLVHQKNKVAITDTNLLAQPDTRHKLSHTDQEKTDIRYVLKRIKSIEMKVSSIEKQLSELVMSRVQESVDNQDTESDEEMTLDVLKDDSQFRLDNLDQAFNDQGFDAGWANHTELLLDNLLQDHAIEGTNILSIECREHSCRMEAEHANRMQQLDFEQVVSQQPMGYYLQHLNDSEDSFISIVFLDRLDRQSSENLSHGYEDL